MNGGTEIEKCQFHWRSKRERENQLIQLTRADQSFLFLVFHPNGFMHCTLHCIANIIIYTLYTAHCWFRWTEYWILTCAASSRLCYDLISISECNNNSSNAIQDATIHTLTIPHNYFGFFLPFFTSFFSRFAYLKFNSNWLASLKTLPIYSIRNNHLEMNASTIFQLFSHLFTFIFILFASLCGISDGSRGKDKDKLKKKNEIKYKKKMRIPIEWDLPWLLIENQSETSICNSMTWTHSNSVLMHSNAIQHFDAFFMSSNSIFILILSFVVSMPLLVLLLMI